MPIAPRCPELASWRTPRPLLLAAVLAIAFDVGGRGTAAAQDAASAIDDTFAARTVRTLADVVEREYFSPEAGARVAGRLRRALDDGRYDGAGTLGALAEALTHDMQAETADKHLAVSIVRRESPAAAPTDAEGADRALRGRRDNFGVRRVEVLPGNVGYLDLTAFYRLEEAREAISSAMGTLRNADALIVDLRHNGGGSPGTVALLASFLFDEPGLPLFDVVDRSGERNAYATERGAVAGRDGKRPTYALTAAGTFSGGEGLAFLLQERHRAEIVGERTAGAANPGRPYPLNDRLEVTVPNGRVAMAVSGRNWEGTGVEPDVPCAAGDALRVAHGRALRVLLARPVAGSWRETLRRALSDVEAAAPR